MKKLCFSILLSLCLVFSMIPVRADIAVVEAALPTLYDPIFEYPFDYDAGFDLLDPTTWGDHLMGWISWEYVTHTSLHVQWEITHGLTPGTAYYGQFEGFMGDGTVPVLSEDFGMAVADPGGSIYVDMYWDLPEIGAWYAVEFWLKEANDPWEVVATNEFNPLWWNSHEGDQPPWFPPRPPFYLVEPDDTPPITNTWTIEVIDTPYPSLLSLYNMAPMWVWEFSWSYQSIVFGPIPIVGGETIPTEKIAFLLSQNWFVLVLLVIPIALIIYRKSRDSKQFTRIPFQ